MQTLIAYATKYGGTKICAERIAGQLPGTTTLHNLDDTLDVDLTPYDTVVIGTSIYLSKPRKSIKKFCSEYKNVLLQKNLGLFLCCIQDLDKTVSEQFKIAFDQTLRDHATVLGTMGGIVDFTKLKSMDRVVMNMVAGDLRKKTGGDVVSTLSDERIARFSQILAEGKKPQ